MAQSEQVLFDFTNTDAAQSWQTVNDGVMGGRSNGRFAITEDQTLKFFGTLSLANNGGFASVRSKTGTLGLESGQTLIMRVKGDGRTYSFNLYVPGRRTAYSYRLNFDTKKDEWVEVELPLDDFVATWFGRVIPNQKLPVGQVNRVGILLGDKKAGPFNLEVDWIKRKTSDTETTFDNVTCDGLYPRHLQGICVLDDSIYWSFTTDLVKTDSAGKVQRKVPVDNHHGDLCAHDGKIYVAVNLGKFNDPAGNADSWVYVYNAQTLEELSRHPTPEVFHGAGGIGVRDGRFFVVGGLPDAVQENYVYEYTADFEFVKKHVIASGHTLLGIQTACFAEGKWWFGCYGSPSILLVTDSEFEMLGRHEFNCSLGIVGIGNGRLLSASGACSKPDGCSGQARIAIPDESAGLKIVNAKSTADSERP